MKLKPFQIWSKQPFKWMTCPLKQLLFFFNSCCCQARKNWYRPSFGACFQFTKGCLGRHVKSKVFVIYDVLKWEKALACPEERDRSEPPNSPAPISSPDSMSPDVLRTLCRWTWRAKCNFSGAAARAVARQTRPVLPTQLVVICFFGQLRLTSLTFYFA